MARHHKADAHTRRAIAAQAARLMAEDGQTDFGAAKRKAARQLGLRDTEALPDNAEIEAELRAYQALYQNDEQRSRLRELRTAALEIMRMLSAHRPYLAGPVWKGTATRGARVDIDLFTDDSKLLELWLINRGIPHVTADRPHFVRAAPARVPVLRFDLDGTEVALSVFSRADERNALKHDAAEQADRGTIVQVEALIAVEDQADRVERFLAAIR